MQNQKSLKVSTTDLIKEIQRLPLSDRIYVIEKIIRSIRKQQDKIQMTRAAEDLHSDYVSDKELTAFTDLDFEDFYETK